MQRRTGKARAVVRLAVVEPIAAALLVLSFAACSDRHPQKQIARHTTKPDGASALALSGDRLTITPLVSAPLLEVRATSLGQFQPRIIATYRDVTALAPVMVEIRPDQKGQVVSAALVFPDGHRLVSSITIPGAAGQNPNRSVRNSMTPKSFLGHPLVEPKAKE